MPDWFTHSLIGWITGKTTKQDIGLIVIGSLIPDLVKINLLVPVDSFQFFEPLHTPIGALLVAGFITLLFQDLRKIFIILSIGISTHFILDFFLMHVYGGMKLLFPFKWESWQYYLIRSDDYRITICAIFVAFLVYGIYWYKEKRKKPSLQ